MKTAPTLTAFAVLFAIFINCRGEEHSGRVILVPPEKLGFTINPDSDPFSNTPPMYLSPAIPLMERLQDQTGLKFPNDSRIFYDINSRALSIFSSQSIAESLASALQIKGRPNVIVELQTYESRQPEPKEGRIDGQLSPQSTIVSKSRFPACSGRAGSLRIKVPDPIAKSGVLTFQITPTVGASVEAADAEITLIDDDSDLLHASERPALLRTKLTLEFNTMTSIYEHQLPSGGSFKIAVLLRYDPGNPEAEKKPR